MVLANLLKESKAYQRKQLERLMGSVVRAELSQRLLFNDQLEMNNKYQTVKQLNP